MSDVVLVNVPWGEYKRPSMQLGLVQALLSRSGIACTTEHAVLRYAETIGEEDYARAEDLHRPYAEWVFTAAAFDQPPEAEADFQAHLRHERVPPGERALLRRLRAAADTFVEATAQAVLERRPRVIGFTTAMLQTTASAAVARAIKVRAPDTRIVFGGAHCEAETGDALMRALSMIDVCVTEQCDAWVDQLFARLIDGAPLDGLPGILWREGEVVRRGAPGRPFADLDSNPVPEFGDYFDRLDGSPLRASFERSVPFEGSRGCWWGQRRHCRFCGLNGTTMQYRHRSADRIVKELVEQRTRHAVSTFIAVDEILPKRFFRDLPEALEGRLENASIFYEMTPAVSRAQLVRLAGACSLYSQPGIEHLSEPVLERIGKGISAAQNVAFLRRAEEMGVGLLWNMIFGIPGETAEDYKAMLAQMGALHHLPAPNLIPLTLARYSPYDADPARFGIRRAGPQKGLAYAYPVDPATLEQLALNFEYERTAGGETCSPDRLAAAVAAWTQDRARAARLDAWMEADGRVVIEDTRCAPRLHRLCAPGSAIYRLLEAPTRMQDLPARLRARRPDLYVMAGGSSGVARLLDSLGDGRLVWTSGDRTVALAVPRASGFWTDPARSPAPAPFRIAEPVPG